LVGSAAHQAAFAQDRQQELEMPLRRALGPVSLALAIMLGAVTGTPAARALDKPAGVDLTVVVTDLRSDQGKIKLALWRDAEGFTDPKAAVAKLTVEPLGKMARVTIRDLPPGTYALASYALLRGGRHHAGRGRQRGRDLAALLSGRAAICG
jgi:hypothetical protein